MGSSGGILIFSYEMVISVLPNLRRFFLEQHFPEGVCERYFWDNEKRNYIPVTTSWQDYLNLNSEDQITLENIFCFYDPTAKIWRASENDFLKYDLVMISYGDNIGDWTNDLVDFLEKLNVHPIGQEETWT